MKSEQNEIHNNEKARLSLLFGLLDKKNVILKKYRKKFEELKINQLKSGLLDSKNKHE